MFKASENDHGVGSIFDRRVDLLCKVCLLINQEAWTSKFLFHEVAPAF